MSGSSWGAPDWRTGGEQREGLPQIEDLPIAERGYDQEAVREAFDRFYRHAAQLDSTLRVLESVEAFSRQARDLRADIRSLRAASWGPAPSARHVWSVGHEAWAPEEPPGALAASLPRLALWAALIVAVGVGAALADLSTVAIVAFVLGAWVLVGLIELVIASRRATRVPAPLAQPEQTAEPVAAEPEVASVPVVAPAPAAPEVAAPQETMISTPAREPVEADDEAAPASPEVEPEAAPALPEVEPEAVPALVEPEAEPEAVPAPVEPEVVPAPVEAPPAVVAAAAAAAAVLDGDAEPPKRGLFRRRREQPVDDTDEQLAGPRSRCRRVATGRRRRTTRGSRAWTRTASASLSRPPRRLRAALLRRGRR